jgi:hypothetical protein
MATAEKLERAICMLAAATSARALRIEHNGRRCCVDESLRLTVAMLHRCGSGGVWSAQSILSAAKASKVEHGAACERVKPHASFSRLAIGDKRADAFLLSHVRFSALFPHSSFGRSRKDGSVWIYQSRRSSRRTA